MPSFKKCLVPECLKNVEKGGLCAMHRSRKRRGQDLGGARPKFRRQDQAGLDCSVDGCGLPAETKGLCNRHYVAMWKQRQKVTGGARTYSPLPAKASKRKDKPAEDEAF